MPVNWQRDVVIPAEEWLAATRNLRQILTQNLFEECILPIVEHGLQLEMKIYRQHIYRRAFLEEWQNCTGRGRDLWDESKS